MTTEWSVTVDAIADRDIVDVNKVINRLNDRGASVTSFSQADPRRLGATFTVAAPSMGEALTRAVSLFTKAIPGAEVVSGEVMLTTEQDRILEDGNG